MLRIATPGVPLSTPKPGGTLKGIEHAKKLGLSAMEMEWVQRVPENVGHVADIRAVAQPLDFALTVHAPFFINLNSQEKATLLASKKRILASLKMAQIAGAVSVCVHPAFYQGMDPTKAYDNVRRATDDIMKKKDTLFPNVNLAFETMGKPTQFGTLEEVLKLSKEFGNYPCIDPAHLHARTNGAVNTTKEWNEMLDLYVDYLGKKSLSHMHMHFSGILYGPKGEKSHLPIRDSDANWKDFLKVLKDRKVGGILVSESPLLEGDALFLQEEYKKLR